MKEGTKKRMMFVGKELILLLLAVIIVIDLSNINFPKTGGMHPDDVLGSSYVFLALFSTFSCLLVFKKKRKIGLLLVGSTGIILLLIKLFLKVDRGMEDELSYCYFLGAIGIFCLLNFFFGRKKIKK